MDMGHWKRTRLFVQVKKIHKKNKIFNKNLFENSPGTILWCMWLSAFMWILENLLAVFLWQLKISKLISVWCHFIHFLFLIETFIFWILNLKTFFLNVQKCTPKIFFWIFFFYWIFLNTPEILTDTSIRLLMPGIYFLFYFILCVFFYIYLKKILLFTSLFYFQGCFVCLLFSFFFASTTFMCIDDKITARDVVLMPLFFWVSFTFF